MEWCSGGFCWTFQSVRSALLPDAIKDRQWLLAVSLRNPMFSNQWIKLAINAATAHRGQVVVTLVDDPYVSSVSALSTSEKIYCSNMVKLKRQRSEQLRRIEKIIKQSNVGVSFKFWKDLCASTPHELTIELTEAFIDNKSRVRELVLDQVAIAHPEIKELVQQTRLAKFFIDEAPVLINYYYAISPGTIDVYPGPQARFFWELDAGLLVNELPKASLLASAGLPHVYCHSS